ncbi:MAG: isoleucine--tRNA ligase, partial [Actinobacteria bacterium]|nr:isoleucine--tRNA ligase [Actinomycetota bacterium]
REVSSVANALRKREGKRVRLPLPRLTVVTPDAAGLAQFDDILREELNVKTVEQVALQEGTAGEYGITHRLSVNARAAGPRLGKQVQQAIKAAREGDWSEVDGRVVAGGIPLEPAEYDLVVETAGRPEGEALAVLSSGGFVLLDTVTTPELEAEGLARDMIRGIQDTRKAAGFDVSDRIFLSLTFVEDADARAVAQAFDVAGVASETLAESVVLAGPSGRLVERGAILAAEHETVIAAKTYANTGAVTVAVARISTGGTA